MAGENTQAAGAMGPPSDNTQLITVFGPPAYNNLNDPVPFTNQPSVLIGFVTSFLVGFPALECLAVDMGKV